MAQTRMDKGPGDPSYCVESGAKLVLSIDMYRFNTVDRHCPT